MEPRNRNFNINILLQTLQKVPSKLSSLAIKLSNDPDIQTRIRVLARDGKAVSDSFSQIMKLDGGRILTEKIRLVKTSNPTDVNIDKLRETLKNARSSLTSERKNVVTLQTDIHSNIEECNKRKKQHKTNKQTTQNRLHSIPAEITRLDESISAHEDSVRTLEQSASNLDGQAENLRRAARTKRKRGIFGAIVGIVLAPFTGGASLIAAGIGGVNINDAADCNRNARRLREDSASKIAQSQGLRSRRNTLETQKRSLEAETSTLEDRATTLHEASVGLQDVTDVLRSSVGFTDKLMYAIEDMDTAMKAADLQTNSFQIIQNALASHPERLEAKSQVYLDRLKDKWNILEDMLLQHGAKTSLN